MKELASKTSQKPNQIYSFSMMETSDEVKSLLPVAENVRRTLRRIRSKHNPSDPASLEELIIPEDWTLTGGKTFLQFDSSTSSEVQPPSERFIIFGTDNHVAKLRSSTTWCMDGNFTLAPKVFVHIYTIFGKIKDTGTFLPLVYVLLSRKACTIYENLFCKLKEL